MKTLICALLFLLVVLVFAKVVVSKLRKNDPYEKRKQFIMDRTELSETVILVSVAFNFVLAKEKRGRKFVEGGIKYLKEQIKDLVNDHFRHHAFYIEEFEPYEISIIFSGINLSEARVISELISELSYFEVSVSTGITKHNPRNNPEYSFAIANKAMKQAMELGPKEICIL